MCVYIYTHVCSHMINIWAAPRPWGKYTYGMFAGYQYHVVCYCLQAMFMLYKLYGIIGSSSVGRWLAGRGITGFSIFTAKTTLISVNVDDFC